MIDTTETPEDVERLLAKARKALYAFEDGVDWRRLLLRLRTASPAHPVLIARALFGGLALLAVVAGVIVMVITVVNNDLARELAKFEAVIPYVPQDLPALPAVLGFLALLMVIAWAMGTGAALAIGRDAQMLPWEQKQHQKLVNEVTRLTTQKAVMERIMSTPAGARPRIATPVADTLRHRSSRSSSSSASAGFGRPLSSGGAGHGRGDRPSGRTPSRRRQVEDTRPSYLATPTPRQSTNASGGFGRAPAYVPPAATSNRPAGGGLAARVPQPSGAGGFAPVSAVPNVASSHKYVDNYVEEYVDDSARGLDDFVEGDYDDFVGEPVDPNADTFGGVRLGADATSARNGIRGREYPDGVETVEDTGILAKARAGSLGMRSTPYGSAGRIRPGPVSQSRNAPPADPRVRPPIGFPGTPESADDRAGAPRPSPSNILDEVLVLEEEDEDTHTVAGGPLEQVSNRRIPSWGPVPDQWLTDALSRSEDLVRSFPVQAYLEFSQEPHLPFTLVIARATPAMAVRAMVNFVEFLAGIYTPPRARIELVNVAHLDRSFHKNVEAALEPYFGSNVEIEPNPGRVDILFTDPDPGWGNYPLLPME